MDQISQAQRLFFQQLGNLTEGGTIELPAGEFFLNLIIDRPMTLKGRGPCTHLQAVPGSGPVITIKSSHVILQDFGIEHLDASGVALFAEPLSNPTFHQIQVVQGVLVGVNNTTGLWQPYSTHTKYQPAPTTRITKRIVKLLDEAEQLENDGLYQEAKQKYDEILELDPTHSDAHLLSRVTEKKLANKPNAEINQTTVFSGAVNPRLLVCPNSSSAFSEIADAVAAAPRGAVIVVSPGVYRKPIYLDREMYILPRNSTGEIIVDTKNQTALRCSAEKAVIRGIHFRGTSKNKKDLSVYPIIEINSGEPTFESCDLSGHIDDLVQIRGAASPLFRSCTFHHNKGRALFFADSAKGFIEKSIFTEIASTAIELADDSNVTIRDTQIENGAGSGVIFSDRSKALLERVVIAQQQSIGVEVLDQSAPILIDCKIEGGSSMGIYVNQASGTFEGCIVTQNAGIGINIQHHASPLFTRCRITHGRSTGVSVSHHATAAFVECGIENNALTGVVVHNHGKPTLRNCSISHNAYEGVWVYESGEGRFEANTLLKNGRGAWDISPDSDQQVTQIDNRTDETTHTPIPSVALLHRLTR